MMVTQRPIVAYTAADAERANDVWGCNCGPGAIAGVLGLTLDALRPNLCGFEAKRYTNPTLMWEILRKLGVRFRSSGKGSTWPDFGLARIQWEGPWTAPGVPARAAYRHTHWVGAYRLPGHLAGIEIFDINAIGDGGWIPLQNWRERLVPWLLEQCEPKASGGWYITHSVEIKP